ncbi:unnamed protein product [Callosobruchus maculatus]|uniref:Kazal-like domain-containing protein n=1 Tax=Callosobruchus maculatus TaxID=64391 RepID=A0A653BNZ2_CALMS|nr:unnamed protein product [Callosobruchus maculatus]
MVSRPSSAMSAVAAAAASSANSHHPHHHHGGPFSMTSSSSKGEPPHGRCTELLQERVSREQCCASPSHTTAYSEEELDSGTLFFWRVLGGGVKCMPCKNSCTGVVCPADRKCSMRAGAPKCVCTSKCERPPKGRRGRRGSSKGPVCGTDGRTYRDACRLRKNACRKRKQGRLEVAYEGHCQQSCSRIQCPMGKHCLLDQNLRPHCAACLRRCPTFADGGTKRAVCAVDGRTYPSACHLRAAACTAGRAVPIAYRGPCKARSGAVPASGACGTRCGGAPPVAPTAPPPRVAHATGAARPGGPSAARTASPTPPGATCSRRPVARGWCWRPGTRDSAPPRNYHRPRDKGRTKKSQTALDPYYE